MAKILFVDCCVRGRESRTYSLCQVFLEQLELSAEGVEICRLPVFREDIKPLNYEQIELRNRLVEQQAWEHPMFCYARGIAEADYILVGAPYWDLSFPACLKLYIEAASVSGLTFTYIDEKEVGLCRAKKLFYLSTAGGFVPENHSGEEYMEQISRFYGIGAFEAYCLDGLDVWGEDTEKKMKAAEERIRDLASRWMSGA